MKNIYILIPIIICELFQIIGCGPAIKKFVNQKYPPVSSIEKSAVSVKNSISELDKLPKIDLGIRLDESFLDSTLLLYFNDLYKTAPNLGIPSIEKIEIVNIPKFSIAKQEIIVSAGLTFLLKENKYLKNISIDFSGRLSPSMNEDSLIISPSFERIHITKIKLKRWLFLGSVAKEAINIICQNFMNNINGRIKTFVVKINYPPFPEKPLSSLLGADENISVTNDYTFKLQRKTLHPVILMKPGSIAVIAGIVEEQPDALTNSIASKLISNFPPPQPNYILEKNEGTNVNLNTMRTQSDTDISKKVTLVNSSLISIKKIQLATITDTEFNKLFDYFDTSFTKFWNANLDILPRQDSLNNSVRLSYDALSRITNQLFKDAKFGLKYFLDTKSDFPEKEISLGEIGKPDCNAITFDCQFNDCSRVLSDCGSCNWYDALCHVRWAACQTYNGIKYAACQSSNVAKAAWCAGELVARKTLCYTEIAAIFIYDNLIKNIGKFGGYAKANGTISGDISQTIPNGISNLTLNGNLNADINAQVNLKFYPSGIIGHLLCNFPVDETFIINHVRVNNQPISLRGDIERRNALDDCILKINFQKISIPIQISEPLLLEILKKPLLVLNCGFSIGLGITVTTILALAGNENFKNYLRAALFGSYKLDIEKNVDLKIPPIPINIIKNPSLFYPSWGNKSIVFTKK